MKNFYLLCCVVVCCAVVALAGVFFIPQASGGNSVRSLAFAARGEFKRRVRAVFHGRRVSSKGNTGEKVSPETVLPHAAGVLIRSFAPGGDAPVPNAFVY